MFKMKGKKYNLSLAAVNLNRKTQELIEFKEKIILRLVTNKVLQQLFLWLHLILSKNAQWDMCQKKRK